MACRASMRKIVPSRVVAVAALQLIFATSWTHSRAFLLGPERDLSLPAVAGVKSDVCTAHRPLQLPSKWHLLLLCPQCSLTKGRMVFYSHSVGRVQPSAPDDLLRDPCVCKLTPWRSALHTFSTHRKDLRLWGASHLATCSVGKESATWRKQVLGLTGMGRG